MRPSPERVARQALFFDKFGQMIHSAVPMDQALDILEQEFPGKDYRQAVSRIRDNFKHSRSDLLRGSERLFPSPFVRGMVKIGVEKGALDYALLRIAGALEREARLAHA